ncbi:MAG TPA: EpsI family protein, partial [Pyrinomonadaceae bacterium]|nr:EpsI family protein [Pyrinomonadaceae bacterium]
MNFRAATGRFWVLLVALIISGVIINTWERAGEAKVSRKLLKEFPAQLGTWEQLGRELRFDDETETILRADDYLARNFKSNGHVVSLYVGYYATQRTGAT